MSHITLKKDEARKLAEQAIARIKNWRQKILALEIDNELSKYSRGWRKFFKIKPPTRKEVEL